MPSFWLRITQATVLTPLDDRPSVSSERRPSLLGRFWEETVIRSTVIPPLRKEESSYQITEVSFSVESDGFMPRTSFGKELLSLRNRAIASGMRLLSDDEILKEVKSRRGGLGNDEAYVY